MTLLMAMSSRLIRPLARTRNPLTSLGLLPSLSSWRSFSSDNGNQKGDVLSVDEVVGSILKTLAPPDEHRKLRSAGVHMTSSGHLSPRRPEHSRIRAVIPLGTDVKGRDKYINATGDIRLGRILEDVDVFAGCCCVKHNRDPHMPASQISPFLVVTALVDQIDIDATMPPLSSNKDIFFDGKVTWVGQSSMESTVYVEQELEGKMQQFLKATVVFACRDPFTHGKALVSPLDLVTDEDKEAFRQGIKNKEKRIQEASQSVLKIAPSKEESLMIHDIFLSSLDPETITYNTRTIEKLQELPHILMQRNVFNKIYGGFLMRKAFELAHTTAVVHSKCRQPRCKFIDDIMFLEPVEIGCLLFFSSQIVYNNGSDLQIRVHAKQIRMSESKAQATSNDCHFTFDCSDEVDEHFLMPQVLPKTYAEAMLYVDGKRRYDESGFGSRPDGM